MRLNRHPSHDLPADASAVKDDEYGLTLAFFHRFSSRASGSLGASSPSPGVVKMALERKGGVKCVTIPDELAMQAAMDFAGVLLAHLVMCDMHLRESRRP